MYGMKLFVLNATLNNFNIMKTINDLIKQGRYKEARELMDKIDEMRITQFDTYIKYFPYVLFGGFFIMVVVLIFIL